MTGARIGAGARCARMGRALPARLASSGLCALALALVLALVMGNPAAAAAALEPAAPRLEAAFSPDDGAEALVLRVIGEARQRVHLSAYAFTSPSVAAALIAAHRRGVRVALLVDAGAAKTRAGRAALNLVALAGIDARTVGSWAILHDKYIVVDARHVQTGSFNYSRAAARSNSENVLVAWDAPALAARYLAHWHSRAAVGTSYAPTY